MLNLWQLINKPHLTKCVVTILLISFDGFLFADELDTFQFSSSFNRIWDSNLFRRSINESSDQVTTYTAGVKVDKKYSLQRVIANVNYVENRYQNNDFLNFDTVNYDAAWEWKLTPGLSGTISSSKSKSLTGFADFRNFTQNIRTNEVNQFRAEYSPHYVWKLIAGVTNSKATNSQTFNANPTYNYNAFDYGAGYNFPSGATISLLGHNRSGSYSRDINAIGFFDNGFSEDEYEFDLVFKATGKSSLSSKLAYISREYDNFKTRDYDAWNGFVRYGLFLTGKLKATADLSRNIGVFESNYSTYTQTDSLSLSLDYYISSKILLSLNGRLAERDFKQPVISGLPHRIDEERSLGATVTWAPTRFLAVSLKATQSMRDAKQDYNQFDYNDFITALSVDLKI